MVIHATTKNWPDIENRRLIFIKVHQAGVIIVWKTDWFGDHYHHLHVLIPLTADPTIHAYHVHTAHSTFTLLTHVAVTGAVKNSSDNLKIKYTFNLYFTYPSYHSHLRGMKTVFHLLVAQHSDQYTTTGLIL